MDSHQFYRVVDNIAKDLLPQMPPIEKLYPPIKNEKTLINIKQDEKSTVEYNKILNNYENNFRRAIESELYESDYRSAIEKGKEFTPPKMKRLLGSVKREIKEKISERFENLQVKAKGAVEFSKFIKETEEEIGGKLIDAITVKKMLCVSSYVIWTRIKNLETVRHFKFQYSRGSSRYYFSKSDIEKLVEAEKDQIPKRQRDEQIRDLKSKIKSLQSEIDSLDGDDADDERVIAYIKRDMNDIKDLEAMIEKLKRLPV